MRAANQAIALSALDCGAAVTVVTGSRVAGAVALAGMPTPVKATPPSSAVTVRRARKVLMVGAFHSDREGLL
ncbi:hypothetical protein GCM10009789_44810 [Kribbella sancticallisti]|uniref:Uncharacterized protein n=1 Tax=Kribbella sancticallisti TaxID=460087 RepID=A0ABN2DTK1_9ACTN